MDKSTSEMQRLRAAGNSDLLYSHSQSPFCFRDDEGVRSNVTRLADFKELDQQSAANGFHHQESVDLSRSSTYNGIKTSNISVLSHNVHFGGGLTKTLGSAEMGCSSDTGQFMMLQKGTTMGYGGGVCGGNLGNSHFENWENSNVVPDQSQQTENSTDTTDEKNQLVGGHRERTGITVLAYNAKSRDEEQKTLRRLAQNREAARKSRMRKKAYVQQLEKSKLKLKELEKDITRSRQQGITVSSGFSRDYSVGQNGSLAFDMEYAHWLDEHHQLINDLRSALSSHAPEVELQLLVDSMMSHYDNLFRIKSSGLKSDVFHILSGMWKTPVERCLMWLGGFRPSEMLKVLGNQIEPLTEQQLVGICDLQQSLQQAEDALSQGMEALQQTLVETLSSNVLNHQHSSGQVADYMNVMVVAMSKLATIENFLHQADLLRLQTLLQLRRILTSPQAGRALLAIEDYKSRLQALSSLWLARPKVL